MSYSMHDVSEKQSINLVKHVYIALKVKRGSGPFTMTA